MSLLPLLLAASIDAQAALRHASALAALGPHPIGSPRGRAAADYVAASFRQAGLQEVRLQEFEAGGVRGANVLGVIRAGGPEFVLLAAHHDTAPLSPGACNDGGGVGVLIEVGRALARTKALQRTLVLVSFDGGEAAPPARAAGSAAYVDSLGAGARDLVAAVAVEVSGFKAGTPTLHSVAYPDPVRPGGFVIAPAWLVRTALEGAREAGSPLALGDPLLSWLYQPAVRSFRVRLLASDASFLAAGRPAALVSDASLSRRYPFSNLPEDTSDKLDAASLGRMGQAVRGLAEALARAPRGRAEEPTWFAAGGAVLGPVVLWLLALGSLAPGLLRVWPGGGLPFGARIAQALLFLVLMLRAAVPALWAFLLPNLVTVFPRRAWPKLLSLLPLLGLAALGAGGLLRGAGAGGPFVTGLWLRPWELATAAVALGLLFVPVGAGTGPAFKKIPLRKKGR